jgi:fibronectin type 3 domain-containing protein
MQNLYLSRIQKSFIKGLSVKVLFLLSIILFNHQEGKAYVWDGQFDATYNQCDGSFTFTTFLFQDCPGCDDYVNANFALQFKDNTGIWQKIVLVKAREIIDDPNGWGNQFGGFFTSFNNLNVQQWRLADGNIGNFTVSNGNVNPFVQNNWINVLNENDTNSFAFAFSSLANIGYYNSTIPGQNQIFNNDWWANSGGVYQEPKFQVSTVTLGLATYIVLKWINPPTYLRNQATAQFRMPYATTTNHNFSHKSDVTPFNTYQAPSCVKTVQVDQLKVPSGLTATKNANCNTVSLSWSPVEDYCNTAFLQVYRDGNWYQFINNANTSSFTDNSPVKGANHSYTVRVGHWQPGSCTGCAGQDFFQGAWSQPAVGKVKSAPPVPFGLTATDNKCNKTIELAWNVNQSIIDATPHTAFRLHRALDTGFTSGLVTFDNLGEGSRSYVDTSIQNNVKYYYRIMAKNGCSDNAYDISAPSNRISGISPGTPPKVTMVDVSLVPVNKIKITWNKPSPFIDNFVVTRSLLTGGGTTNLSNLSSSDTTFTDSLAQICVDYVYRIKSTNVCNTSGIESDAYDTIRLDPVLDNTFETSSGKILVGSKGYYPNRVELNWSNNNSASITGWKIYRKNIAIGGDSTLIASPSASSGQYIDYTADANVFYKYTIVGEASCGTVILKTNTSEDIGFRYPSGTISGNITYEGGIAVKDVKIVAQPGSGNSGYAMNFTGISSGAQISPASTLNSTNPYTIEFWLRPTTLITDAVLIRKADANNTHYSIIYNKLTNKIDFSYKTGATTHTVSSNFNLATGTYTHVTAVKEANKLKLYKNGVLLDSIATTAGLNAPNVPIDLGYNSSAGTLRYNGSMDELRIYKRAKTSEEIAKDFNRYINPEDNDLVAYFPFDENVTVIRNAYDLSKSNGQFNRNKVSFQSGNNYTATIPNASELNNIGYTDTTVSM